MRTSEFIDLGRDLLDLYLEQPLLPVFVIAVVTYVAASRLSTRLQRRAALIGAAFLCLPAVALAYPQMVAGDFLQIAIIVIRIALLDAIYAGLLQLIFRPVVWFYGESRRNWDSFTRFVDLRRENRRERREAREEEQRVEHEKEEEANRPPYAEAVRLQVHEAEEAFELESSLINDNSVLDGTEKHVALIQARQRFLQRLKGLLE